MTFPTTVNGMIVVLFLTASLQAAVVPGRWDKVDKLASGEKILVKLKSGDRLEGAFSSSSSGGIELMKDTGGRLTLAKSDIARIVRAEKIRDKTLNGTLIGTGVGFGIGFGGLAAHNASVTASGPIFDGESVGYYTLAGLMGAGIGALVGTAMDAAHQESEVLYQAN